MEVRRAAREEVAAVDALLEASALPPLPAGQPLSNLLVALDAGVVVGAVALEVAARRGLLRSVVVAESHRRQGVGGRLVSTLVARAHELGLRDLYLLTTGAAAFFASREFAPVDREALPPEIQATREFRECPETATAMRLPLETRL